MQRNRFSIRLAWMACLLAACWAGMARASESELRDRFMKQYWSVLTTERMNALDLLAAPQENETVWTLFTVSYWDPEKQVREKAFRLLTRVPDEHGVIASLCAQSFAIDKEIDAKVQKAAYMKALRYRHEALRTLVSFVIRKQMGDKLAYPYGGAWGWYGWHGWGGWGPRGARGGSPGVGRTGHGFGLGGWGIIDPMVVHDDRVRLQTILDTINYFGGADFKARLGVEKEVESWWERKEEEIKELDRRTYALFHEPPRAQPEAPKQQEPLVPLQIRPRKPEAPSMDVEEELP
ncbi:MAG: hypothetical protein M5U26_04630 [Planctomycetota bacterium]|nr:hypothetical protein [Planctomycetota bacterium]